MKLNLKVGVLAAAAGAFAIAVPAAAHPGPHNQAKPDHPSTSHKCTPHNVAYVESGTIVAAPLSTLAENSDGTWTGMLAVDFTRTNHAARKDKNTVVPETFTNAKLHVKFADNTTAFTSGERVTLIGKLATVAKKCTPPSTPATPVFRMIVVHPATS